MELLLSCFRFPLGTVMNTTHQSFLTTWLRTDHPVVSLNASTWNHLPAVEAALHRGVRAVTDVNRPRFYEIEIGGYWYYIHIPNHGAHVYLVAASLAQNRSALVEPVPLAV